MGLDTTHDAFHGAYSSFGRFRSQLLSLAQSINIDDVHGYGGHISPANILDEGVRTLINHSDCDGDFTPDQCKMIADSLEALIPKMDIESELYSRSVQFRNGCLLAYSLNESIEFH